MAKAPPRRSMSVKGVTYQRFKNYCDRTGQSMSGRLEEALAELLDDAKEPVPSKIDKPHPRSKRDVDEIISQHFTF